MGAISAMLATSMTPHTNMKIRPTMKLRSRKISMEMKGCAVVSECAMKK